METPTIGLEWPVKDYPELPFPKSLHAQQQNAAAYHHDTSFAKEMRRRNRKVRRWRMKDVALAPELKLVSSLWHRNRSKVTESELVSNSAYLDRIIVPNHPHSLKYPLHLFSDRLCDTSSSSCCCCCCWIE